MANRNQPTKLIAVVGPTGSGKTALAVQLAKKFDGIIISADSRQVYRGLDVGTNKEGEPGRWESHSARIIDGIPQLLIDVAIPGERFTLNDWLIQARYALERIWAAGKLPIVVGGTGLYVTALLEGYQPGGGRGAKNNQPVEFESLILHLNVDREILNRRSDERFPMIYDRLMSEVKALLAAGVSPDWLKAIGLDYRYIIYVIRGVLSREAAISQFQQASRQYIRRQLTWWRHHGSPLLVKTKTQAAKKIESFIK